MDKNLEVSLLMSSYLIKAFSVKLTHEFPGKYRSVYSPGHCQKWICGDVMRNGNMAAKARHTIRNPFRALFGA